jgi:glyoxylase-like metal-dependent hydrolase (beta-lactamase superfamily II)
MTKASANVRMYRLNELGDCFLVTFAVGGKKSRMLIDCGSFRNSKDSANRLKEIVTGIESDLAGAPLDVVVGTHQHNDHLSGFVHCKDKFEKIKVKQVWLSWLDDPTDAGARKIGKTYNNLVSTLHRARLAIGNKPLGARGDRAREVLEDVLGFYGNDSKSAAAKGPPVLPADAVKILKEIGSEKPKYLKPGTVLDMPGLPPDSVRVYVLGPPRADDFLFDITPKKGESYDKDLAAHSIAASLAARNASALKFLSAVENKGRALSADEVEYPFEKNVKRRGADLRSPALKRTIREYHSDKRRTIDGDWLDQAESLALYLDTYTNNSSLVLAIELVASGKVLLFAADAQTGNWLSWPSVKWDKSGVKFDDLMAKTVFYKVGHHASHNATLPQIFEKLTHSDLVALIPVHKKDPNITKPNGWKMPATNLRKKLIERTSNRVLQMDNVNPASCDPTKEPAKSSWKKAGIKPNITPLFIELEFAE